MINFIRRPSIRGDSEALLEGVQLRSRQMAAFLLPHSGGETTVASSDGRGTKAGGSGQKRRIGVSSSGQAARQARCQQTAEQATDQASQ